MAFDLRTALTTLVEAALAVVAIWLVAVDAREHRLPNRIVLPTLIALLVLIAGDALLAGESALLVRSLLGMIVLGGLYAVLRAVSRGGIGGGDVKLAAVIGVVLAWHGWDAFVVGAVAAFLLGALFALVLIVSARANGKTRIAFGPWMIIGAVLGIALV